MEKTISITIDVEEWFHTRLFNVEKVIQEYYDGEYPETDVVDCVKKLIHLFNKYNLKVTFFILGETAEKYPDLISIIEEKDHEIASHGYHHNRRYNDLNQFKNDIRKFKSKITNDVTGFRFPNFNISQKKLKILAEEGFTYDSSIVPCRNIPGWYGNPKLPLEPFKYNFNQGHIMEFPIAVSPRLRLPGGGGWYLRNVGYWWTKNVVKSLLKKTGFVVIYFHPWEISHENPRLRGIPFHVFRNTGKKCYKNLCKLIETFSDNDFVRLDSLVD